MDATTINSIIGICGIGVSLFGIRTFVVNKRKRLFPAIDSLRATVKSINDGRTVMVAVLEDFPEHKDRINALRPYLLFRRNLVTEAFSAYEKLYEEINSYNPIISIGVQTEEITANIRKTVENVLAAIEEDS